MSLSLFRILQEFALKSFANQYKNSEILEIGGDKNMKYCDLFHPSNQYIVSNFDLAKADEFADVTNLHYKTNSFDAIVCISVLQHVYEINKAIDEIIRVLKPGGKCMITNGYMFPICMEYDYYRLTPRFWKVRLEQENVKYSIEHLGNKYAVVENLLNRPYGNWKGLQSKVNKIIAFGFKPIRKLIKSKDNAPLGVVVIIEKNL